MVQGLYDFWLKELADYYIEAIKPVMNSNDADAIKAALNTLFICLDSALRMLHPTMPYLTEELFQRLPHRAGTAPESICIAAFPKELVSFKGEQVEEKMDKLQTVISGFRKMMSPYNIKNPELHVRCADESFSPILKNELEMLKSLLKAGSITVIDKAAKTPNVRFQTPEGTTQLYINDDISTYIKIVGFIDINEEIQRKEKRNGQVQKLLDGVIKKMSVKGYEQNCPESTQKENLEKKAGYESEIKENLKVIEDWKKLM